MSNHKALGTIALLVFAAPAFAADVDLTLHLGNTYTDNALRVPNDGPSDNIGGAAAKLDLLAQGAQYDADVRAAATYLYYFSGTNENELLRGFSGDLQYSFIPERFAWIAQENYGPVLEDPLSPDRPDNWTYDSYFTTGPDVQIGDEAGFHALLSGRYSRADYESEAVPSNQQYTGQVSFSLAGTARSERSLILNARRVEQEAQPQTFTAAEGYDIQEAYLRFANTLSRGSYYIDAGASALHDDEESSTQPLLRVGMDRVISRLLTLTLAAGTQYSEDMRRFGRLQQENPDVSQPNTDVAPVADPLQEEFAEATLELRATRTTAALRVAYNKLDYQHSESSLDKQEYENVTLEMSRIVSPRLTLDAGAALDRREYSELARKDDDIYAYLAASWSLSRDLQMRLTGRLEKRDSSDPLASYTEHSVQLEFIFQAFARKNTRRAPRLLNRGLR